MTLQSTCTRELNPAICVQAVCRHVQQLAPAVGCMQPSTQRHRLVPFETSTKCADSDECKQVPVWMGRPETPALLMMLRHRTGCQHTAPLGLPDWRPLDVEALLPLLQLTERSSLPHVAAASFSGVPCPAAMCRGRAPLPQSIGAAAPPSREPMKATTAACGVKRSCHAVSARAVVLDLCATWPDNCEPLGGRQRSPLCAARVRDRKETHRWRMSGLRRLRASAAQATIINRPGMVDWGSTSFAQ